MAKYTQREVDPQRYAQSRRRFLRNAGIGVASLPFFGSLADTADAASSTPTKNPWPSYPAYKFAFVCHVTADVFFNAVRAGASDMSAPGYFLHLAWLRKRHHPRDGQCV